MSIDKTFTSNNKNYPVLPLRDIVVFPCMVIPLFIGRSKSIKSLEIATKEKKNIMLVAQKSSYEEYPSVHDVYKIGCVSKILQIIKLPDDTIKILIEGLYRAKIDKFKDFNNNLSCDLTKLTIKMSKEFEYENLRKSVLYQLENYIHVNKKIPLDILKPLSKIENIGCLTDAVISHLPFKITQKQKILEECCVLERIEMLLKQISVEIDIFKIEKKIMNRVKKQMEKSQREYYLNEQVKAIQKELGEIEEISDFEELEKNILKSGMSNEAFKKSESEFKKLKLMTHMSSESNVVRNFLETLISLPWRKKNKLNTSIHKAELILNKDHYGLKKIKELILEYLSIQQRVKKTKSPILCLVGPPGVGKTSLGKSISKATNRKFVRMSLGGIRDEAEIRGHRRTYIGSMPGKIIQNIIKISTRNPLFLLDEIDKLGTDFRGDPSSALLEVLDPEQNNTFQDHYVEVNFDLSDVMFVATSNTLNIPPALLDRMEIICISGYTDEEKINIAFGYLLPKLINNNGVKLNELKIKISAIISIINFYTRESGVRSLEREIGKVCRKVIKKIINKQINKKEKLIINDKNIHKYLGIHRFDFTKAKNQNQIGEINGLAWTECGGDLINIEVVNITGKGLIKRTGSLGNIMKESIDAAYTIIKSRSKKLGISRNIFEKCDIHIHVPEGSTPKDGPSAGIALTTAIFSSLSNIPICSDVAMTGEITLRGEVLPIGGIKEKLLAAYRANISKIIIPEQNIKDLSDVPNNIKNKIKIFTVKWIDKVLELSLENLPECLLNF